MTRLPDKTDETYLLSFASSMLRQGEVGLHACLSMIEEWVDVPSGRKSEVDMTTWLGSTRLVLTTERILFISLGDNDQSAATGELQFGIVDYLELGQLRGASSTADRIQLSIRPSGHIVMTCALTTTELDHFGKSINRAAGTSSASDLSGAESCK